MRIAQFWEAIFRNSQIYKALKDIPLNMRLGYYRKQFRMSMKVFYQVSKNLKKVKNLVKKVEF